jgi:hypothetical protein
MAWRLGDKPQVRVRPRPPRPKPPGVGPISERERDPGRADEYYPNVPWTEDMPPYTGPPGYETGGPGPKGENPLIDFDALLRNDPRTIRSKAKLAETIAAAGIARKAALDKAMIALGLGQKEVARGAGFQQADLGANLAGRGMVMSGALGAGTQRVEETRQRGLADVNRQAQETQAGALSTEADIIRTSNQAYLDYLAEIAADLAKDPRYQPKEDEEEEDGEGGKEEGGGTKGGGTTSSGSKTPGVAKAPPAIRSTVPAPSSRRKHLKKRLKAGRM